MVEYILFSLMTEDLLLYLMEKVLLNSVNYFFTSTVLLIKILFKGSRVRVPTEAPGLRTTFPLIKRSHSHPTCKLRV